MELNVFEYFKDYKRTTNGPMTPEEQGTSLFLAGNMGQQIREYADVYATKNRLSGPRPIGGLHAGRKQDHWHALLRRHGSRSG